MTRRRQRSSLYQRLFGSRDRPAKRRPDGSRRRHSGIIGRDLAPMRVREAARRRWLPLLIGGLMAALCLTALRIDLIRQRYDLATAMSEEKRLLEERRLLTARVRRLRDPARLSALAQQRGFERPVHVTLLGAPSVALGPRP